MRKTNKTTSVKYGLVYKNHGKWSKIPSDILTENQIVRLGGAAAKRVPFAVTANAFTAVAAQARKQPARLIKIS